jgi:hypothetical protein
MAVEISVAGRQRIVAEAVILVRRRGRRFAVAAAVHHDVAHSAAAIFLDIKDQTFPVIEDKVEAVFLSTAVK